MPAPLIYINGFPGVGKLTIAKLTIAKHLQPLLPGSQILHNHELIDPVEKHCSRRSARYKSQRQEYRQQRLKPIREDPKLRDTIFIFTDSQMESSECVSDYTDLCLSSEKGGQGRRLYSVILECEKEENERRLVLPGRGSGENGKLTDVEVLREYRSRGGVLKFGDADEIVVDVMGLEPEKAARKVAEFVEKREREGRSEGCLGRAGL